MDKEIKIIIWSLVGILIVFACVILPWAIIIANANSYEFISVEENDTAGITKFTLIYLHNGEVKYMYYDEEYTKDVFLKVTGMAEK